MSKELQIEELLGRLSSQPPLENVTNPYKDDDLVANLRGYFTSLLSFPFSGHLLVGEAPGYKGCAQCGIPFTSQRLLNEREHPFILTLRKVVVVRGNETEVTATKVWNQLEGKKSVPAFWNMFPFHPWVPGNPTKNRTPSPEETKIGLSYLDFVVSILRPHTVVAIGGVASRMLQSRYPELQYRTFSHPSMRGYPGFLTGFAQLGLT